MATNVRSLLSCAAVIFLTFGPGPTAAKQKIATYGEAKDIVIKNGFKPMVLKHDANDLFCDDDNLCRKRPEVYFCSGMGLDICYFAYERPSDKRHIVIETYGEYHLYVKGVRRAKPFDEQMIKERQ